MEKQFTSLDGTIQTRKFDKHDISKYEVLFHVTNKNLENTIKEEGLKIGCPLNKSIIETNLLFVSYPIDMNTSDCFRWNDDYYCLVMLDAKKLHGDGYVFYDDIFGMQDRSSKRNHLCIDRDIPKEYIKKIVKF